MVLWGPVAPSGWVLSGGADFGASDSHYAPLDRGCQREFTPHLVARSFPTPNIQAIDRVARNPFRDRQLRPTGGSEGGSAAHSIIRRSTDRRASPTATARGRGPLWNHRQARLRSLASRIQRAERRSKEDVSSVARRVRICRAERRRKVRETGCVRSPAGAAGLRRSLLPKERGALLRSKRDAKRVTRGISAGILRVVRPKGARLCDGAALDPRGRR